MRQQRLNRLLRRRGQAGLIKPTLIVVLCGGIFATGVYLSIAAPSMNESSDAPVQKDATIKTFEVDTSGIVSGQSLGISGQLRVNNTLVLNPSSQPAQTTAGQVYYDESANEIRYYNGTSYQGLASKGDVQAALQQQPAVVAPVVAAAPQAITNVTQQTINNYDTANGAAIKTDDNTFVGSNIFTGANSFADVSVQDFAASGAAALQGSLTVTGTTLLGPASATSLLLSSALNVASGGTGRDTFNANEIVIGQGTGALTTISNGTPGLCLVSTAGAPSFLACPGGGGGGVTSLAGLTGDLLVANSSTSGSTITIDAATSTNRGLASFNATNLTVTSGSVNTVQDIAVTATPTFGGLTVNGTFNGQTISSTANFTGTLSVGGVVTANTITPNASMVIGANGQNLTLQGSSSTSLSANNGANKTTLDFAAATANVTYRLQSAAAGTYNICTTVGNCTGLNGGVTTVGGTSGALARFNGSQTLVDSLLSESGSVITVNGTLAVNSITPTAALTVGSTAQSLILQGDSSTRLSAQLGGITNSLLFSAPGGSNKSIVLPNASGTVAVSASGPIAIDANGNITCASCTTSGGGAGGAVDSLNGINGAVLLNNSSVAGSTITINDASTSVKGIASFNSSNFTVSNGAVNTIQNIGVSSSPTFNALTLSTPLSVASGGTGASTAAGARTNLGAASSGANTDITSLGGLSTALSLSQGGTGATSSQAAINSLSQLSTEGDLLYHNGTNSTRLARGSSGQCLTSSMTSVTWSSCGPGEADTLSSVTARGATTNTGVFLQGGATSRGLTIDTASATDDTISLAVTSGGASQFTGQITAEDLTANRTWTLPDASGTFCLQGSASCGFLTGSASNYIQNQNAGQQATSNFWLSGTGRADTALQAPVFDTSTATTLTLGGNATSISVVDNVTMAAGTSLTVTGGVTGTRPGSPTEGMVYYDTTTKQLLTYANGKWQADRSSSTKIVGTSAVGGTSGAVASAAPDGADYINTSTTSAQAVINSAITALPAGGGTVYLMEGTYIIDGTIVMSASNISLVGAGPGTVLKLKNGINAAITLIDMNGSGNTKTVTNMRLDGNSSQNTSNTQRGIDIGAVGSSTSQGATLTNLTVENFWREGVYGVGGGHSTITNSYFAVNQNGVYLNGVVNSLVSGNAMRANTSNGIFSTSNQARIIGNKLTNNGASGMDISGTAVSISGNTVETSGATGISFNGIRGSITGNTVTNSTGVGILLDGSITNTIVNANTISGSGSDGIRIENSSSNNTVSNNIITGSGTVTASRSGIAINTNSNYNQITYNQITDTAGTGYAITIPGPGNDSVGTYLSGNTYSGTGATSISDLGTDTIYASQLDTNGNLINRGAAATSINTSTVSSSLTLQGGLTNSQLPTPALPVISRVGTAGTTTYGYRVTALDGTGETLPSTEGTIATANATLTGANYNVITWVQIPGAVQYKIYRTTSAGTPASIGLIGTVTGGTTVSFNDTGIAATTAVPGANTTGGLSIVSNIQGANATLTGGTVTIGTTSQQGSLVISDGSSNTATLQVGNLAGNYTYSIPVTTANDTFCMLLAANCGGVSTIGALDGGAANATGATISGSTLFLQSASGTNPGLVNTTAQTFAGDKTFSGILSVQDMTVGAGKSIYVTGGVTGTRPGAPTEGMVYFDTTTKQLIAYANGKWQASRSSSTKIVAASNSSQSAKDAADYVATGTGDQAQINSALTAAAGGTVYLMEGSYVMSGQVSIPNNTTLSGAGSGTILTVPNAQNGTYAILRNTDTSTGTNITIRDLQLDGNRANQTGGSMTGINFAGMGAGTGSTARPGSKINNVIIKNMRQDRGISLTGSNNTILGSTFQYNEIQAINLNGSNNVITGNTFLGNQNYTINVTGSYNTVTSNLVESGGADGIRMTGTYSTITGNTVTTSGAAGIIASGAHTTVTGNTSSANNGVGIHVSGDYGTVTGNSASANTSDGIRLQTNYSVASGNNIDNNSQAGIMIYDDNNQIASNRIHNNGGDGIQCFATCNNNSIVDNYITDTAGSSYAIELTNFAGTPTGNYLANNHFSGTGASSINDEGSGTIYSNQKDGNGTTINRTQGGALTIGTSTATASLTLQGGMVSGQLTAPVLSATVSNVGTAGTTTYRYQVTAVDGTGETVGSTIQQTTTGNATLSGTNYNTITWTSVPGAVQYGIYKCSGASCTPLKKTTVAGNAISFNDQSAGTPVGAAPVANSTGGITIAGNIQGASASLSSGLTVAGASLLNGTLTATNTALFKNTANSATAFQIQDSSSVALFTADTSATKIVIRSLDVSYNLTVAGHIITGGSTPTVAADAAACTTPTVSVSGTDTAGSITVTTGTGCTAPGNLATVTFATAFGASPKIALTPAGANAAALNAYLDDASLTTGGFSVGIVGTPTDTTTYKWHYYALQ